ncbi:hypothetical protein L1887_09861 [Cichorium endivia]|nr:hypothetical protein L1887_09861 [Cichorium endivia]
MKTPNLEKKHERIRLVRDRSTSDSNVYNASVETEEIPELSDLVSCINEFDGMALPYHGNKWICAGDPSQLFVGPSLTKLMEANTCVPETVVIVGITGYLLNLTSLVGELPIIDWLQRMISPKDLSDPIFEIVVSIGVCLLAGK